MVPSSLPMRVHEPFTAGGEGLIISYICCLLAMVLTMALLGCSFLAFALVMGRRVRLASRATTMSPSVVQDQLWAQRLSSATHAELGTLRAFLADGEIFFGTTILSLALMHLVLPPAPSQLWRAQSSPCTGEPGCVPLCSRSDASSACPGPHRCWGGDATALHHHAIIESPACLVVQGLGAAA